jgi:hypothetical protein
LSTLNFETIQKLLGSTLSAATPGTSTPKFACGISSVVFTASDTSATASVAHGLGVTPQIALTTATDWNHKIAAFNLGASTFDVKGKYDTSITGTATFYWLAIG